MVIAVHACTLVHTDAHTACRYILHLMYPGGFPLTCGSAVGGAHVLLCPSSIKHTKEYKSQSKACFEVGSAVLEAQRVEKGGGAGWGGWLGGGGPH